MKQADLFIYVGLLIFIFGIGHDTGKLFSADIKLTLGIASVVYGVLLYIRANKRVQKLNFNFPKELSELPSKVYFTIGILLFRIDRFMTFISDHQIFVLLQITLAAAITGYGIHRFYFEKRMKRESGNIEE